MAYKCPFCGRFVSRIKFVESSEGCSPNISGVCYSCGRVSIEYYENSSSPKPDRKVILSTYL